MIEYVGTVYRPPSEARSLILQITIGCSWNKCTFCRMYQEKKFSVTPEEKVFEWIDTVAAVQGEQVRRVFLADGDALCLKTDKLIRILQKLQQTFPNFQRAGIYAYEPNIRRKSDDELKALVENKLTIGYLGLESGDEETLRRIKKGCTAEQMVEAAQRMQAAGMKASVMTLLGMGGVERSREHAKASAAILNRMQPRYTSFLTVTPVEGTPLADQVEDGSFVQIDAMQSLQELRWIAEDLVLTGSLFRSNHASNYLPIGGTLPKDKDAILEAIDGALAGSIPIRPEHLRGL